MARATQIGVPAGKIATIVTSLEMTARPPIRTTPPGTTSCMCTHHRAPDLGWYRDLYARVGTDWLWSWRLAMSDTELAGIIHDPRVEVHALHVNEPAEALLELDFRAVGECELKLFGLTAGLIGTGTGRWLMNHAIETAWARPITRFWVHTCTLDHPGALEFYIRSGFRPFSRHIEIEDDPRYKGLLPKTAAPHIPMLPELA
jgi:GNAT superfamily N-acetyltransferase